MGFVLSIYRAAAVYPHLSRCDRLKTFKQSRFEKDGINATITGGIHVVRIFLVDDNAMIRSSLRSLLEKRKGWKVVGEAENGRRALEKWSESSPQVTVMDFMMPEMNGLEASRQLTKAHPDAPILMVTVDPVQQLEKEARKAGIRGLVTKSDLRGLFAAIESLLKGKTYFRPTLATA
jgi:DNA-binding NarL/FixJ family response regulator